MLDLLTVFVRIIITFVLTAVFGIERQRSHKPIGFGTFIFVAIGSCGLAITATNLNSENPLPLLAAIVSGIGFLGAGALIRTTDKIFGFTTAASIWLFAVFGLIMGVGEYLLGILVYLCIWAVIFIDRQLEKKGAGSYQRKIIVNTNKLVNNHDIENIFIIYSKKFRLIGLDVEKTQNKCSFTYLIEGTKETINKIPRKLYEQTWFESFKVD